MPGVGIGGEAGMMPSLGADAERREPGTGAAGIPADGVVAWSMGTAGSGAMRPGPAARGSAGA